MPRSVLVVWHLQYSTLLVSAHFHAHFHSLIAQTNLCFLYPLQVTILSTKHLQSCKKPDNENFLFAKNAVHPPSPCLPPGRAGKTIIPCLYRSVIMLATVSYGFANKLAIFSRELRPSTRLKTERYARGHSANCCWGTARVRTGTRVGCNDDPEVLGDSAPCDGTVGVGSLWAVKGCVASEVFWG